MITEMNAGDDVQVVDPKSGSGDATTFLKMQQRLIGGGQGISYETAARDMSETTYSSARQASIEDEATFGEEIELLQDVMSEIYETFLISAILAGKIAIPDFWEHKELYLGHEWVASPKNGSTRRKKARPTPRPCKADKRPLSRSPLNRVLTGSASLKTWPRCKNTPPSLA